MADPITSFEELQRFTEPVAGERGAGRTEDRPLWPGLRDRQAQERGRPRLDCRARADQGQRRDVAEFFARPTLRMVIDQPFVATNRAGQYDVLCTVTGGGLSGQAGALRHGISRALTRFEPALRPTLKAADS